MTRLAIRLRLVAMLAAMLVVVGLAPIAAYAEDAASPAAVEERSRSRPLKSLLLRPLKILLLRPPRSRRLLCNRSWRQPTRW